MLMLEKKMSFCEYRPRMLGLFSGSGNFCSVAQRLGFDVVTLDIDSKFKYT